MIQMMMRPTIALVALLVAGCASAPPIAPPVLDVVVPEAWTAAEVGTTAEAPAGSLDADWWTSFGDPDLTAAVEAALSRNYDLQAAAARLEQAAAAATVAEADLKPSVQAALNGSRRRQTFVGFPIPGAEERVLSSVSTNWGVSLDVSWELDVWGRLRAGAQAALADLQGSAADLRGAQLSIAGQTVKAWFTLAEAEQQVRLSRETVASFGESVEQVRQRFEAGIRPAIDLRLALLNLANAEALLQQRLQQRDAAARQVELLLGEYADGNIAVPDDLPATPPRVPGGLPAELVLRRPDLLAAERRLAAAQARLSVREKALLPGFSLTSSVGTATNALRSLLDGDFWVWSLLSNVVAPLWQGGRLRAETDREEALVAEVLATYANTALRAFAEVETALAAETFLETRARHLTASAEQARAAERLADERYRAGLDTFIPVLESQRSAVQAEGELIAARRLRLENRVDLYLALGGGFDKLASPFELNFDDGNGTPRP